MTTTTERLLEMAASYEEKARGLRIAAAELNGHQVEAKREALPTQLEKAITIRKKVRKPKLAGTFVKPGTFVGKTNWRVKKPGWSTRAMHKRREKTADFLTQFGKKPRTDFKDTDRLMGTVVRYGYLKPHPRGGWVRTDKPFTVAITKDYKPAAPLPRKRPGTSRWTKAETRKRRTASAVLLDQFSTTEARYASGDAAIGPLVNNGYLIPAEGGYLRSEKVFEVEKF